MKGIPIRWERLAFMAARKTKRKPLPDAADAAKRTALRREARDCLDVLNVLSSMHQDWPDEKGHAARATKRKVPVEGCHQP